MPKKYTDKEQAILRDVGYYFLSKTDYDEELKGLSDHQAENKLKELIYEDVRKANEVVSSMKIKSIKYHEDTNTCDISLGRPGLLIGEKGAIIGGLEKKLNLKIHIIEDMLDDYLYSFNYVLYGFDD